MTDTGRLPAFDTSGDTYLAYSAGGEFCRYCGPPQTQNKGIRQYKKTAVSMGDQFQAPLRMPEKCGSTERYTSNDLWFLVNTPWKYFFI